MKAIAIQQPFAFEIMTGVKTIEMSDLDTLHRGDILVCSARKPVFPRAEMEEMEEEYGCTFLYGHALFVANLVEVRPMREGDEEEALIIQIDPEANSWVYADMRPVIPFPVKTKEGLFSVDDNLIRLSPFGYDDSVVVRDGTRALDFGLDFSGWSGRTGEILLTEDSEPRIRVVWDSVSLRNIPPDVLARCVKEQFDWTAVLLRLSEVEHVEARDTWEDVEETIEKIVEENPSIFK